MDMTLAPAWSAAATGSMAADFGFQTLQAERCVEPAIERNFLVSIERVWERNYSHSGGQDPLLALKRTIREAEEEFLCLRSEVDSARFTYYCRVESIENAIYRLPRQLHARSYSRASWTEFLRTNPDGAWTEYETLYQSNDRRLHLGNEIGISFVTESDGPERLHEIQSNIDALALSQEIENEATWVVLVLKRSVAGRSIHVPSGIDGCLYPKFELQSNCDAKHGLTKPDDRVAQPLPEAVHLGGELAVPYLKRLSDII